MSAHAAESAVATCQALAVMGEELTGVSYVRFQQPFSYLRQHGFELNTLGSTLTLLDRGQRLEAAPRCLDGMDLLLFSQSVAEPTMEDGRHVAIVEPLCEEAQRRGIPIVYSTDDFLSAIDRSNPQYEQLMQTRHTITTILNHASAILVTTDELHGAFANYNLPIHILPNCIDPHNWRERARATEMPRIGWCGSSSHLEDLLLLLPAVRKLQARRKAPLHLLGLIDISLEQQLETIAAHRKQFTPHQRATADRFEHFAAELDNIDFQHRPFTSVQDFPAALADLDLDIGLCPLQDTPFNRHKSCVKYYEYAASGSMTLASNVLPYCDEVSELVPNDPDAWCDALDRYLGDSQLRKEIWEQQRSWVFANRNIETWSARWAVALRNILGEPDA